MKRAIGGTSANRTQTSKGKVMAWTHDEDAILTHAVVQGVSLQRLTVRLNRSRVSIVTRARELGLEIKTVRRLPVGERSSFPSSTRKP
jgi:hypothetical protein